MTIIGVDDRLVFHSQFQIGRRGGRFSCIGHKKSPVMYIYYSRSRPSTTRNGTILAVDTYLEL